MRKMASENMNLFDADQQPQQSYIVGTVSATFWKPDSFYKVLLVKVSPQPILTGMAMKSWLLVILTDGRNAISVLW